MQVIKCKICLAESPFIFKATVLKKYTVSYYRCDNCGFIQTENPYWLNEAYSSAIGAEDTGIMHRNLYLARISSALIGAFFNKHLTFVDYAGGYGIFTRLMRDRGFNYLWHDPYASNLIARGFEYKESVLQPELISAFEAFEHFENPIHDIEKMLKISRNILFSTRLVPDPVPQPQDWWYYSLNGGQHISLYTRRSLEMIAVKYKLNLYTNGKSIHLLTEKRINDSFFKLIVKIANLGWGSIYSINLLSKMQEDMHAVLKQPK